MSEKLSKRIRNYIDGSMGGAREDAIVAEVAALEHAIAAATERAETLGLDVEALTISCGAFADVAKSREARCATLRRQMDGLLKELGILLAASGTVMSENTPEWMEYIAEHHARAEAAYREIEREKEQAR